MSIDPQHAVPSDACANFARGSRLRNIRHTREQPGLIDGAYDAGVTGRAGTGCRDAWDMASAASFQPQLARGA